MNREVGGSHPELLLNSLKSRYPCFYEPLTVAAAAATPDDDDDDDDGDKIYLTSLWVFGSRQVDGPESPLPHSFSYIMVDQNGIDQLVIKEKITSTFKILRFRDRHVLVQFWSPIAVRKRWLLTTWDQPFGLGVADEELYLHRLKSERRAIVVDEEHKEDLGPPGRVYSQKLPEWSLDVKDGDSIYDNHGYIDLPVYEPSSDCCVGVLEIISSSSYVDYAFEVQQVSRALEKHNLKSPAVFEDPSFHVADERRQHELDGIFSALRTVCDTQRLPLAQTWALSGYSSYVAKCGVLQQSCSSFSSRCIGKACMSSANLPFYVRDLSMWGFREACMERHLEKSRGVAGRSLSSHDTWFCGDVTELDEDEYPLVSFARISGMTSCLTIYLKSLEVNAEYVLEFFLPRFSTNASSLQTLRETVKQQFKSDSLMQLDIMSPPQFVGKVPLNWNLESPPSPVTLLTGKGEVEPASENMEKDNTENKPSSSAVNIFPNMEKGIEESTQRTDSHPSKGTNRKTKRSESLITLDELKKHFGKTMDEAATTLKVSRSTLKRICRNLGIPRWPYKNGPDKSESLMKSDPADVIVHMSEGALTPVVGASSEQLGNDPVTLKENG